MVIFHSYVKLPEGTVCTLPGNQTLKNLSYFDASPCMKPPGHSLCTICSSKLSRSSSPEPKISWASNTASWRSGAGCVKSGTFVDFILSFGQIMSNLYLGCLNHLRPTDVLCLYLQSLLHPKKTWTFMSLNGPSSPTLSRLPSGKLT